MWLAIIYCMWFSLNNCASYLITHKFLSLYKEQWVFHWMCLSQWIIFSIDVFHIFDQYFQLYMPFNREYIRYLFLSLLESGAVSFNKVWLWEKIAEFENLCFLNILNILTMSVLRWSFKTVSGGSNVATVYRIEKGFDCGS